MKSAEYYQSREQTYLKHFFLEHYLERVGFNICSFMDEFVYVDGFSGPWKSEDEKFEDTSFMIAIQELRKVRDGVARLNNRSPKISCVCIEKKKEAFGRLKTAVQEVTDIQVEPMLGEFEQVIPKILDYLGTQFSLVFIDPTGWTGFALNRIQPILRHQPGEVIVNFMFDFINRRFNVDFNDLFGGAGWNESMSEEETIQLYCDRLTEAGKFDYGTYTRIMNPTRDRTYFYLVYGTRHWKGLWEFRNVERKFVEEQERIRWVAKQKKRIQRTGQAELFAAPDFSLARTFDDERALRLDLALSRLREKLRTTPRARYEDMICPLLEIPLVWPKDVNEMIMSLHGTELDIEGLTGRERTPKPGHMIVRRSG